MKINEINADRVGSERIMRRAVSRQHDGLGMRAALLGALCVVGVFATLGLLYTFG